MRENLLFLAFITCILELVVGVQQNLEDEDCPFGIYGTQDSQCICLPTGLWGIAMDYCSIPLTMYGVQNNTKFCILNNFSPKVRHLEKVLTLETPEVAQMSLSMHKLIDRFDAFTVAVPFPEDVYQEQSLLVSYGESKWRLKTVDNETFCLVHRGDPLNEYCLFEDVTYESKILRIKEIIPKCEGGNFPQIFSTVCSPLKGNRSCGNGSEDTSAGGEKKLDSESFNSSSDTFPFTYPEEDNSNATFASFLSSLLGSESNSETDPKSLSIPLFEDNPELEDDLDKNVVKRDEQSDKEVTEKSSSSSSNLSGGNNDLLEEDEDKMSAGLSEIGHKLMRDQIDGYVDTVVAQMTGLSKDGTPMNRSGSSYAQESGALKSQGAKSRFPILKILNTIKLIMQKTCSSVKEEYFDLALNSFLKVQFESLHAKEPYLSQNSFLRMDYALKTCYNKARPHVFGRLEKNDSCPDSGKVMMTTSELDVHGDGSEIVHLNSTPMNASGLMPNGGTKEPLIETVWKMLVNAHSYCFPYFKTYFNDHHTLTVSLLPLFNNQIQDIWLKEGGYDTSRGRLYGGLLGDTMKVLTDVDNCVSASRQISQYPWYMSRPLRDSNNKWRKRKRRDAEGEESIFGADFASQDNLAPVPVYIDNGNKLCLYDPDDVVSFLGKPVCT